jgi:hypothetical protein
MSSALVQVEHRIQAATDEVVRSMADTDDGIAAAVVGRNKVINSSFLYRDKSLKTIQSSRRLLARLIATGKRIRSENIWIIDNEPVRTHYKIIPRQETAGLTRSLLAWRRSLRQHWRFAFHTAWNRRGTTPPEPAHKQPER